MQGQFQIEEDNLLLKKVCLEIKHDKELKRYYPLNKGFNVTNLNDIIITECKEENKNTEIINLIVKLLEDISFELDKGLKKDKAEISRMIFALHNLPRVYLNKEENTVCLLGQNGITPSEALKYSKLSMNEDMLLKYKQFFIHS